MFTEDEIHLENQWDTELATGFFYINH